MKKLLFIFTICLTSIHADEIIKHNAALKQKFNSRQNCNELSSQDARKALFKNQLKAIIECHFASQKISEEVQNIAKKLNTSYAQDAQSVQNTINTLNTIAAECHRLEAVFTKEFLTI